MVGVSESEREISFFDINKTQNHLMRMGKNKLKRSEVKLLFGFLTHNSKNARDDKTKVSVSRFILSALPGSLSERVVNIRAESGKYPKNINMYDVPVEMRSYFRD